MKTSLTMTTTSTAAVAIRQRKKTTDEDATIKQVCRPTNTTAETHCLQKRNETVLTEDGRYFRATTLNGNGRRALMAHWRSLATHNTYLCPTV